MFVFAVQPKFSDDTHEVITPPAALPMPLLRETSYSEQEKTLPADVFTTASQTFRVDNDETIQPCETPKSALLKTHKRTLSATLQKKRPLVGGEDTTCSTLNRASASDVLEEDPLDATMSSEEIRTNELAVTIPSSEFEATTLLHDIRQRRVSTAGLSKHQISSLVKLISTMTGTDERLVYE